MEKMLVTQALKELKLLDDRILRELSGAKFVACAKTSEKNVNPGMSKEQFVADAKASWQSVQDLINRRERIKTAIVDSNAKTMVEICGETMSVAKAIDTKASIEYKTRVLITMKQQYANANGDMEKRNQLMESKIDSLVTTAFGKDSKTTIKEDDFDAIAKPYRAANECSLVDPLGIVKQIKEYEDYITEFRATVDQKLQVSNCITYIEF